LRHLINRRV